MCSMMGVVFSVCLLGCGWDGGIHVWGAEGGRGVYRREDWDSGMWGR